MIARGRVSNKIVQRADGCDNNVDQAIFGALSRMISALDS